MDQPQPESKAERAPPQMAHPQNPKTLGARASARNKRDGVRRFLYRCLGIVIAAGATTWALGGCGWHHSHKPHSYDRAISDEDRDPTYQPNPERADVEVRDVR